MTNTNLVFVYKGRLEKRVHTVDLPAWQKAGWSTEFPVVNKQKTVTELNKTSKSRSKITKNTDQQQTEKEEVKE